MTLSRKFHTLYISACVVPLVIAISIHSLTFYRSMLSVSAERMDDLVRHTAGQLDDFLLGVTRDFKAIASYDDISIAHEVSHHLAHSSYSYPYFKELFWVRADGVIAAASNPATVGRSLTALYNELGDELNDAARGTGGRLIISDLDDLPRASGVVPADRLRLKLLVRVDDVRGRLQGVLVGVIGVEPLRVLLDTLQARMTGSIPVVLLNRDGRMLISTDALPTAATLDDAAWWGSAWFSSEERVIKATAQMYGIGVVRACDWRVVALAPEQLVTADVWQTLNSTTAATLLITSIITVVILWLTRAIVRPLTLLATAAGQVADGTLTTRVSVQGRDEISILATAFNHMIEKVEGNMAMLNTQVAERARINQQLENRGRVSEQLTEIANLLQIALHLDDAAEILKRCLSELFAPHSGAVYLIRSSLNFLDRLAPFGSSDYSITLEPNNCWALRRGQKYGAHDPAHEMFCAHVTPAVAPAGYLCVPMQAQGGAVGLLHVVFQAGTTAHERELVQQLIMHVAEQIALSLANLRLRETLREQSIRDALTGLHNRRYLEESLTRELARAQREHYGLAVFMLDVDHFKRYNDQHGHEAGDAVLRELGRVLKQSVRSADLACRFGGEEFTVILVKAELASAREWAERLLERLHQTSISFKGTVLPGITVSLGLAFYPVNGEDVETVLQAADLALYQAKHAGRDRLVVLGEMPHRLTMVALL